MTRFSTKLGFNRRRGRYHTKQLIGVRDIIISRSCLYLTLRAVPSFPISMLGNYSLAFPFCSLLGIILLYMMTLPATPFSDIICAIPDLSAWSKSCNVGVHQPLLAWCRLRGSMARCLWEAMDIDSASTGTTPENSGHQSFDPPSTRIPCTCYGPVSSLAPSNDPSFNDILNWPKPSFSAPLHYYPLLLFSNCTFQHSFHLHHDHVQTCLMIFIHLLEQNPPFDLGGCLGTSIKQNNLYSTALF